MERNIKSIRHTVFTEMKLRDILDMLEKESETIMQGYRMRLSPFGAVKSPGSADSPLSAVTQYIDISGSQIQLV